MTTPRNLMLNENTRFKNQTGAGILRTQCSFTSKDMAQEWDSAFAYAIISGWHDDAPEYDSMNEMAEKFEWDQELIDFIKDTHDKFNQLKDKQ